MIFGKDKVAVAHASQCYNSCTLGRADFAIEPIRTAALGIRFVEFTKAARFDYILQANLQSRHSPVLKSGLEMER